MYTDNSSNAEKKRAIGVGWDTTVLGMRERLHQRKRSFLRVREKPRSFPECSCHVLALEMIEAWLIFIIKPWFNEAVQQHLSDFRQISYKRLVLCKMESSLCLCKSLVDLVLALLSYGDTFAGHFFLYGQALEGQIVLVHDDPANSKGCHQPKKQERVTIGWKRHCESLI